MQANPDFRAILIADCGMERTRVSLVDVVDENEYRLVAQRELPSTVEPPLSDVTVGVRQAIAELERAVGRQLLEEGRLRIPQGRDGQGLDAFVATCSAAGALPVLVMAVTADITARSAVSAAEGTYAVPFRVVTIEDILRDSPLTAGDSGDGVAPWWKALEHLHPGGVLMVGGVNSGNVNPLRTLSAALAQALPPRPTRLEQEVAEPSLPVVYAGNHRAQEVVTKQLADLVDLRVTENVQPNMRRSDPLPACQELTRLYEEQVLQQLAGYEGLSSWTHGPVQLPYMGLQLVARFLAGHFARQVLALDLGSGATSAVWADAERSARVVLGHFGSGYGVSQVLARRGVARIREWLPFSISDEEIRHWVLNRALRPRTLPTTVSDFLLSQAVGREAVRGATEKLWELAPDTFEMVVATGGQFAHCPRWSQVLLVLLDALQPTGRNPAGLVDLYLDRSCIIPSIGVLATLNPDAAACVMLKDGLFHLGSCLVPLGRGRPGVRALALELEFPNGMRQQVEVAWGEIVCTSFRWGEEAHLTVRPARDTRVGTGRPGERLTTLGGESIRGGALGLIVDARGRPLELPGEDGPRLQCLQEWLCQCGAYTDEELAPLAQYQEPEPPEESMGDESSSEQ